MVVFGRPTFEICDDDGQGRHKQFSSCGWLQRRLVFTELLIYGRTEFSMSYERVNARLQHRLASAAWR